MPEICGFNSTSSFGIIFPVTTILFSIVVVKIFSVLKSMTDFLLVETKKLIVNINALIIIPIINKYFKYFIFLIF